MKDSKMILNECKNRNNLWFRDKAEKEKAEKLRNLEYEVHFCTSKLNEIMRKTEEEQK